MERPALLAPRRAGSAIIIEAKECEPVTKRRALWPRCVIASHLAIFLLAGYALALSRSDLTRAFLTLISGTSLFVLTSLVHEASHYNLARWPWLNDLLGNLAGYMLATPVSAYRAQHMKHHQTTNRDDDPFLAFNSRWMILFGAPTAIVVAHRYAWRHLRGRALLRYLIEMAGLCLLVAAIFALPRPLREWSLIGPLLVVAILQNIHILTGHLDLPSGKYHDTWQLVLPRWLSVWMLHHDHHLEHHIYPRLSWHELPGVRAQLALKPEIELHRVTLPQFFIEVFLGLTQRQPSGLNAPHDPRMGLRRHRVGSVRAVGSGGYVRSDAPAPWLPRRRIRSWAPRR
jgi:fatty acid desaturase